MNHIAKQLRAKKRKGALLWELMFVLAILFMFLYSTVSFFSVFFQYEQMTYAAKTSARQVEITGVGDSSSVRNSFYALCPNHDNLISYDAKLSKGPNPSAVRPSAYNHIQLGQTFTVEYNATYKVQLFGTGRGLLSRMTVTVPMSYTVRGMSEYYWKS